MIPSTNSLLTTTLEVTTQPSKNYKMWFEQEIVNGTWTDLAAMEQVIYKILNTERYQYPIYSHNYGVELASLYGEPISYVYPEVERRITEALTQDDRITAVGDFVFDTSVKGKLGVEFTVSTCCGEVEATTEVSY